MDKSVPRGPKPIDRTKGEGRGHQVKQKHGAPVSNHGERLMRSPLGTNVEARAENMKKK